MLLKWLSISRSCHQRQHQLALQRIIIRVGRLAAQALLQSTEPLARLRSQIHVVQGQQTIITLDPTYLLRNPLEKAKAWDDLCLALSVVSVAGPVPAR